MIILQTITYLNSKCSTNCLEWIGYALSDSKRDFNENY